MIFASFVFLYWFLPLFLAVYIALPRGGRNVWLTIGSYAFYAWTMPSYVLLLGAITCVDYVAARRMGPIEERRAHRRRWLIVSLCVDLGLLCWFKYANLVVETIDVLLAGVGVGAIPWQTVALPVGISFFVFQSMSYTIDVYRGDVRPTRSLLDFACYVSMFPQLVAGPIVRYRDVARELVERVVTYRHVASGVVLFMVGFAKKVLLADNAALLADAVFASAAPGLVDAWVGVVAYAVQIYFDFSGYSDMAVGLGWMLGFHFPKNFASPYRSASVTEFWRRWHISLSTWLRDYLYIPLGGNRHGAARTYANLSTTMLLGGLWHGASWTFVLWGAWQGLFLMLERRFGALPSTLPRVVRVGATFVVVLFGWAIFRANDLATLGAIHGGMLGLGGLGAVPAVAFHAELAWTALGAGLLIAWLPTDSWDVVKRSHPIVVLCVAATFVLALGQLFTRQHSPFLYFRF